MSGYSIAPSARDDLDSIWDHIAVENNSPAAADRLIDTFFETFKLLAGQPLMAERCHQFEHLVPELRHFPVGNYIVYYRPVGSGINIGHIAHGAMDQEALFREWLASGDLP